MTRRVIVIGVAAAALLGACGSSGSSNGASSSDGKKYVNSMVAGFDKKKAAGQNDTPFNRTQIKCLAGKLIDAVGVDTLKKNGVTPSNINDDNATNKLGAKLSADQKKNVGDAFFSSGCVDMSKLLAGEFRQSMKNQPPGAADCLAKEVVKLQQFKTAMASSLFGDSSANPFSGKGINALLPAFAKCKVDISQFTGG